MRSISLPSLARRLRPDSRPTTSHLLTAALIGLFLLLLGVTPALADPVNPNSYGEVLRLGGFDSAFYDNGAYDGSLTPGKFVDPVGFAVDTQDSTATANNALYVLDRVSPASGLTTSWRLQKLDQSGSVLGSTQFSLPDSGNGGSAMLGLAVDHQLGRVYAIVTGAAPSGFFIRSYARELVAWSTTPDSNHHLVAASGTSADPLSTTAGLVSSEAQLTAASSGDIFFPQGLAIVGTGTQRNVAIEGSDDTQGLRGWATVNEVSSSTGALVGSTWSASSLPPTGSDTTEYSGQPYGISTNADGSLTALILGRYLDAIKLTPDLASATVELGQNNAPPDLDREAVTLQDPPLQVVRAGSGDLNSLGIARPSTSGTGLTQLDNGLWAGMFEPPSTTDDQSPPGNIPYYFHVASPPGSVAANPGVRLLDPSKAGGTLSDATGDSIVNTLGNPAAGSTCSVTGTNASLAAGSGGAVWVLGRGLDSSGAAAQPNPTATGIVLAGREIVELAPGAGTLCPQPSGTFTINGQAASTSSPVTVSPGAQVSFDASTVDLQGEVPFAYDWDLDGNAANGFETVDAIGPNPFTWPAPTQTQTYTTPGAYTVRLRVLGDYGSYIPASGKLIVSGGQPPVAVCGPAAQNATAGQSVSLDGSGSTPSPGAQLTHYIWNWGDGSATEDDSTTPDAHVFAAGDYNVTLTVKDDNGAVSAASAPCVVHVSGGGGSGPPPPVTTPTTSTSTGGTPPPPVDHTPTNVSPGVSAASGAVQTVVSCPKAKASCAGTIQVQTATAVAISSAHEARKVKKGVLLLGSASFTLSGGQSKTIVVHLSSKGAALLRKSKRLRVTVTISAHDAVGNPTTVKKSLTLRAPAKKSSHHK